MKSSIFIAATSAILAVAGPVGLRKRAMATHWDIEVVTVTVTAGSEPSAAVFIENVAPEVPKPSSAPVPAPAPAPEPTTSVVQPPPPPPKIKKPAAPQPQPKIEPAPEPEPTTSVVVEQPAPSADADSGNNNGGDQAGVSGDYKSTCLKQHNIHRSNHSAPALQWDDQLASWAEQLANTCVFEHDT